MVFVFGPIKVKVVSALVCFLENSKGYNHTFFWVICNLETTNRCGELPVQQHPKLNQYCKICILLDNMVYLRTSILCRATLTGFDVSNYFCFMLPKSHDDGKTQGLAHIISTLT